MSEIITIVVENPTGEEADPLWIAEQIDERYKVLTYRPGNHLLFKLGLRQAREALDLARSFLEMIDAPAPEEVPEPQVSDEAIYRAELHAHAELRRWGRGTVGGGEAQNIIDLCAEVKQLRDDKASLRESMALARAVIETGRRIPCAHPPLMSAIDAWDEANQ